MAESVRTRPSSESLLIIRHVFRAPRELVWRVWTKPEHLTTWWSPEMFSTPTCEVDVRPGGSIRIVMEGPDGTSYPMTGEYLEVVPPERLVFIGTPLDAAGNELFKVRHTAVFTPHGNDTLLTFEAEILAASAEAAPHLAGMEQGWIQSLGKLDRALDAIQHEAK